MFEHGAAGDFVDTLAGQPEARDKPVDGCGEQVACRRAGVGRARFGKGGAVAPTITGVFCCCDMAELSVWGTG
ncbi:hypothetical protein [Corynebacterium pilosum]|uniref:hypothetical protein n=1 Tax=Corynebacterium pilosum TaxID=35756 RepID=UPI00128BC692|nr:hypothetical protein [Corynebacterium pilosum]